MRAKRPPSADREEFVSRFRKIVDEVGGLAAMARKSGVSPTALKNYLAEGEPSRLALIALAQAAGVRVGWLAKEELPVRDDAAAAAHEPVENETSDHSMPIRMVDIGDYLKNGAFSRGGPVLSLPTQWVMGQLPHGGSDPTKVRYWWVHDNSMRPDFALGDFALVDTSASFLLNGLFLFLIGDTFYLNNLRFMGADGVQATGRDRSEILFRMTNEQFSKDAKIVGRVFGKLGSTL